ncbi:MAG TPA: hypothetical protein VJH94_00160 [Candidatus Paceibacterota bacterium]
MKICFKRRNYRGGQAMLGIVLLFLFLSSTIAFGISRAVYYQLRSAIDLGQSRSSYYLAEALAEDTAYQLIKGFPVSSNPTLSLDGNTASAQVADIGGRKVITSNGDWADLFRTVRLSITYGTVGSFFYGVQVGEGGLRMYNSSSISGNVHSAGTIEGKGNIIRGDVISAGSGGLIDNIHATSSAYAHTIRNSQIDKNAYYMTLTNTSVGGTSYPNSPDQATSSLPISDAQIDQWETDAASGGSATCSGGTYTIDANTMIGPRIIPCNLAISGNPTITLAGALLVIGNISIQNNPIIRVSSLYPNATIPVIADKLSDREDSSKVSIDNSPVFQGSGTNSYILMISRNNSAEYEGTVRAIQTQNNVGGELLLYAPHGHIELLNSVNLREVTAYRLTLKNSAEVIYKTGLANILFQSGPSGGFNIVDWREVE